MLAVARAQLDAGRVYASFPWPLEGRVAPSGHVRITALAPPAQAPAGLNALVVASPPGDLWGLTRRELQVPGLFIEGHATRAAARTWPLPRAPSPRTCGTFSASAPCRP